MKIFDVPESNNCKTSAEIIDMTHIHDIDIPEDNSRKVLDFTLTPTFIRDIYLPESVKRCDIIVEAFKYSEIVAPLDDAFVLGLKQCVTCCALQYVIAASVGSTLQTHIGEMLETCYMILDKWHIALDVDASISQQKMISIDECQAAVGMDLEHLIAYIPYSAGNSIGLNVSDLESFVYGSIGRSHSDLGLKVDDVQSWKESMLRMRHQGGLKQEGKFTKYTYETVTSTTVMQQSLVSLSYLLQTAGRTELGLEAHVGDIRLDWSTGRVKATVTFDQSVVMTATKIIEIADYTVLMQEAVFDTISNFGFEATIHLGANLRTALKVYSLLRKHDINNLSAMDNLALESLDFEYIE